MRLSKDANVMKTCDCCGETFTASSIKRLYLFGDMCLHLCTDCYAQFNKYAFSKVYPIGASDIQYFCKNHPNKTNKVSAKG